MSEKVRINYFRCLYIFGGGDITTSVNYENSAESTAYLYVLHPQEFQNFPQTSYLDAAELFTCQNPTNQQLKQSPCCWVSISFKTDSN